MSYFLKKKEGNIMFFVVTTISGCVLNKHIYYNMLHLLLNTHPNTVLQR